MKKGFVKVANILLPVNCLHYKHVTIRAKSGQIYKLYVPCGKCYKCRKRIASEWAFRLQHESEGNYVYSMLFTYADEKMPMLNNVPCLNKQQLSDAFKRLRYYIFDNYGVTVKIFAVGEYSPLKKRPHYHAILFSPLDLNTCDGEVYGLDWLNDVLRSNVWPYGLCKIQPFRSKGTQNYDGEVHDNSSVGKMVGYMCTYMLTQCPDDLLNNKHTKPFRYMSKNLGKKFDELFPNIIEECRRKQNWTYPVTLSNGETSNVSYPRYYLRRWLSEFEKDTKGDQYFIYCQDFNNYLSKELYGNYIQEQQNPSKARRQNYFRRLNALRDKEKEYEYENFRKRKLHEDS